MSYITNTQTSIFFSHDNNYSERRLQILTMNAHSNETKQNKKEDQNLTVPSSPQNKQSILRR